MGDLEIVANIDKIKSHAGYLSSMIDAIFFRDPRDHHVWNVSSDSIRRDSEGKGAYSIFEPGLIADT